MIRDVVFEQNYAKKVEQATKMAFQQGIAQGRQAGWNEVFSVVMHLQQENQPITQENVIALINQMLVEQNQQAQESKNE